jgi:N-acetylglucosamine-6-phosphate deacetylase
LHEAGNERLAGAWFQADRAIEVLVRTQGLTLPEAWRFCSELPASIIGETLPAIEVGEEASFVIARWDDGLLLEQSVHHGQPYLEAPIRTTNCE